MGGRRGTEREKLYRLIQERNILMVPHPGYQSAVSFDFRGH